MKEHNREVSIGICGALVGVLLGAGSVVYSQDVSSSLIGSILHGSFTAYVLDDFEAVYRERYGAPTPVAQLTPEEETACVSKVRIVEELRPTILALLPNRPVDELIKRAVGDAFDDYIADCRPVQNEVIEAMQEEEQEQVHAAAPEPEDVQPVYDNLDADYSHCQRLSGARRTTCIDAARDGIMYQP